MKQGEQPVSFIQTHSKLTGTSEARDLALNRKMDRLKSTRSFLFVTTRSIPYIYPTSSYKRGFHFELLITLSQTL